MYDIFIKYFRDELNSEKITTIHGSRIDELHKYIDEHIGYAPLSRTLKDDLREIIKNTLEDSKRLVKIRLVKRILGSDYDEQTIDKEMFILIDKIIELYANILAGTYMMYRDYLLVEAIRETEYARRRIYPGDAFPIPIDEALILYSRGYVKPIVKPYYRELLHIIDK